MIFLQDPDVTLHLGDVVEVLRDLPDESVHMACCSPPFYGLRDYGTGTWEGGGDEGCDHKSPVRQAQASTRLRNDGRKHVGLYEGEKASLAETSPYRDACGKCGAQRVDQQIGLEETPDLWVARLVEVFREVRRVLRADGTLWVEIGDSYAGSAGGRGDSGRDILRDGMSRGGPITAKHSGERYPIATPGLKQKDLIGVPWLLAFALRADGWYLRSEIVWSKPNPMPESVTDRPTTSHSRVFLLTKSPRYFYDAEAIREPYLDPREGGEGFRWHSERYTEQGNGPVDNSKARGPDGRRKTTVRGADGSIQHRDGERWAGSGRNRRSVWEIPTQPYPEAHFATWPEKLVEPMILAGTSERGVCPECGAPWERVVERGVLVPTRKHHDLRPYGVVRENPDANDQGSNRARDGHRANMAYEQLTTGWQPTCTCIPERHGSISRMLTVPATVLDPFAGSGTTSYVARRLGRRSIGVDLSAEYLELAAGRLAQQSLLGGEAYV